MSKGVMTIQELIELIEVSVDSGKIGKDYPDFLKCCRDLGLSSYTLNVIIQKAKENQKDTDQNNFDRSFLVIAEKKLPKKQENKVLPKIEIQTITKIERKTSIIAKLAICIFLIGCIGEGIWLYNLNEENSNALQTLFELNKQNDELSGTLKEIFVITKNLSEDSSFSNWQSSNHEHNSVSSKSYKFKASEGDKLSFNYFTSSEDGYDFLIITLSGNNMSEKEIVKTSGQGHNSKTFVFDKSGNYTLGVKYTKDGSYHKYNDNVGISNINLHRNYKVLLDSIHTISCVEHKK